MTFIGVKWFVTTVQLDDPCDCLNNKVCFTHFHYASVLPLLKNYYYCNDIKPLFQEFEKRFNLLIFAECFRGVSNTTSSVPGELFFCSSPASYPSMVHTHKTEAVNVFEIVVKRQHN